MPSHLMKFDPNVAHDASQHPLSQGFDGDRAGGAAALVNVAIALAALFATTIAWSVALRTRVALSILLPTLVNLVAAIESVRAMVVTLEKRWGNWKKTLAHRVLAYPPGPSGGVRNMDSTR